MKNIDLKFICLLTGYNYSIVKNYDSWSKRKISIFAIALLFPATIWFFNGYFLTSRILDGASSWGILVGIICAYLIFFIERIIIMASESWLILLIRFILGIAIATLGSFLLKEVIFEKDINIELNKTRSGLEISQLDTLRKKYKSELDSATLNGYMKQFKDLTDNENEEVKGKLSPRGAGYGPIARSYNDRSDKVMRTSITPERKRLDSMKKVIFKELEAWKKEQRENEGLMTRINAYFKITFQSTGGIVIFWLFFTILFLLELFVVILKMGLGESMLEKDEKIITKMG